MPSKHILAAYETYANTYQQWNKIPLEWDLKNKKLQIHATSKLLIWQFNICCLLLTVFTIFSLILRQIICKDGNVPLTVLFVNGTSFIVMLAAFGFNMNVVSNGSLFIKGYNQLMSLEAELEALEENSHVEGRNRPELADFFVKSLKVVVWFCYPSAIVVTCFAIYFKIDPGHHVFLLLGNYLGYTNSLTATLTVILIGFFRSSVIFLALLETGRVWPLACIVHVSYKMMIGPCIGVMHRITERINTIGMGNMKNVVLLQMLLRKHGDLKLIMELCRPLDQTALFIQLQMTVVCGVVTNFATVRFYGSLPFVIYHKMPFISLLLALCANAVLKYCHVIADNSAALLILWSKVTGWRGRRGYYFRKVASVRSLRIHAGVGDMQMLWIERGTKGKFFDFILIQTIDLLVAVPREVNALTKADGRTVKPKY